MVTTVRPIAMIEDEVELRLAVRDALVRYGFDVLEGSTMLDAKRLAPDAELLLLDLGLPDGDGLSLCTELAHVVPLIVISARGDEADRVAALELGADDYLAKPFSTRELIARCRSVLRRSARAAGTKVITADLVTDLDAFRVTRGDSMIALTTKEMELMVCLAENVGRPVRRHELAERVWSTSLGYVTRTLDVHMSSLRQKLGRRPDGDTYIETVHGFGYRLRP
jgi:two-component system, OmpR family, response regulator RegX3